MKSYFVKNQTTKQYVPMVPCLLCGTKWHKVFESVDDLNPTVSINCEHSNESY